MYTELLALTLLTTLTAISIVSVYLSAKNTIKFYRVMKKQKRDVAVNWNRVTLTLILPLVFLINLVLSSLAMVYVL